MIQAASGSRFFPKRGKSPEILSTMLAPFLSGHMLKQTATDPVKVWTVARLVASVGGGNYDSLEAAFAAAKAGETVKLLADVAYTGSANIAVAPDGRALVFDLNGKTVTSATGYVLVNFGTLEVKDSSEGAAGKVVCTQGTLLRNFGNLTLTSGTLEIGTPGNYSVVKNDEDPGDAYPQKVGAFTMNGGALKAPATGRAIQAWTSMTVNGGTVDGSIQAWSYNGNTCGKQATITINGGTFNGAVESITYKGSTTASVVDIYGGAFNGALTVTSNGAAESKIVVHTYAADGTTPNNANFASDASAYCESGWGTVLDANTSRYVLGKAAAPGEPIVVEAATAEEALAKTALNIKSPDAKVVSQDSYKAYFTKKATAGEGGTWVVTAELKPEIVKAEDETSELAEDLGDIASGAVTSVSLTNAKPGLFYSAKYTDDVSGMGSASESTRKMANANGAVEIETPKILDSTKMFYQIQVNVTK